MTAAASFGSQSPYGDPRDVLERPLTNREMWAAICAHTPVFDEVEESTGIAFYDEDFMDDWIEDGWIAAKMIEVHQTR
ncbi:hypothetical protein SEA_SKOG_110 [Gordonia phage Skog]|uniref:Uncharacterized protein n=1 Tax=Gordonia phage Skog TaxID=2704033 RepID=A0A6G6XJI6_9CAUD|nr:hypothetical protein KHQ85_gp110 [Gordonia phage Skog]QIG58262.1 hypothetical protein SEA_SKOG_110 [Gordonia phage Skog]